MGLKHLDLPLEMCGKDYREFLKTHLDIYHAEISSILPSEIVSQIKEHISNEILYSIDKYYIGFPYQAYRKINKVLKFLAEKPLKTYQKSQYSGFLRSVDSLRLFRIRHVDSGRKYYRHDIFHTPFHLRFNIGSCRYSISGYPCLYLSTNLALCDQETKNKDIGQKTIASRFAIVRNETENGRIKIKVVELAIKPSDFTPTVDYNSERTFEDDHKGKRVFDEIELDNDIIRYNYLFWYPLIAASSCIKTNHSAIFNPEYIIPQQLMQWIRANSKPRNLIGIRYFSCASIESSDMGFNYVFPVYSTPAQSKSGYCKVLRQAFELTSPVFLHEYSSIEECEEHLVRDNVLATINT